MMGARRSRRAARRQRLRAPLVGTELPAAGRGLVDGAPNERVAESETPGHVGRQNEIGLEEDVQRVHGLGLGHSSRCGGQVRLEGIARHRRSCEHEARSAHQRRELFAEGSCDRRWNSEPGRRDLGS
jgi:hypothetical protein